MKKGLLFILVVTLSLLSLNMSAQNEVIKVVVLGSSTAAGSGPTDPANAWVNLYRTYLKELNISNEVINLAVGGYTTYQVMPSGFAAPSGRPSPDASHNISMALSLSPDVIIINLPTNDAASGYTREEQMYNYSVILDSAAASSVPVYVATTQPRNLSADLRQNLMDMRDSINKYLGDNAIDFWSTIAASDGTIATEYDSGDGVHLNDAAHILLASRVEAEDILKYSVDRTDYDTLNIDLGSTSSTTTGNWNNLTGYSSGSQTIELVTSSGETSTFTAWVHDSFTGVNTTGTTSPDPSTDLPSTATSDSFFGSEVAFNGVTEATGGITIAGLNPDKKYSFEIFASRTGVTDIRETKYIIGGATNDTLLLDASNNTANTVSSTGISPTATGEITITASPGPNNTNSSKFYFFGCLRMMFEKVIEYDSDGVIKVDLGNAAKTTEGNWNNLTSYGGGETIGDLINDEGNHTGFSLFVHDAFAGINDYGTSTPDASLGLEANATADSFFGNTVTFYSALEATAGLTLTNLDVTTSYTFTFFASRPDVTDNRETRYTVTGKTSGSATLNASNNTSNVATVEKIVPSDDGTIIISVIPGENNNNSYNFYYLGAMTITYGSDVVYDDNGTVKIDLGDATTVTSGWNNLTDVIATSSLPELYNSAGHKTGFSLTVHDAFTGVNTAGTTTPATALGYESTVTSDSFFGSEGAHNGVIEASGGVTLSGLDIETEYTLTLFASRAGVTDNREAKYVITGATTETLYLDAANNTASVVSAADIIPAADGTIKIDVTPGPNNNNSLKYYYLGSIVVDYEKIIPVVVYDPDGTINIDCGSSTVTSAGNWNNLTAAGGGQTIGLINDEGNQSGISASVHDAFTGVNLAGTTTPDASLNILTTAASDSFFGNTGEHETIIEPTGGITLSGLDAESYYTFTFFASRAGVTDNRETKYIVSGTADTTLYLDAANNTSNVVVAENIRPDADGIIKIVASPGPNNTNSVGYFYLGVIRIEYGTSPLTDITETLTDDAGQALIRVFPNPVTADATLEYYVPRKGRVQVRLFSITGQMVASLVNEEQEEGPYTIAVNGLEYCSLTGSGTYICQIKVTTRDRIYLATEKIIVIR